MNFKSLVISVLMIVFALISSLESRTEESNFIGNNVLKLELDEVTGIYLEKAEKELNETPERKESSIIALRELLRYERTLKVPIDEDAFLIKFLRSTKYNVTEAYELIKTYYRFREKYKEVTKVMLPLQLKQILEDEIVQIMPKRDKRGRRVGIMNFSKWNPSKVPLTDLFRAALAVTELMLLEPMTQVNSFIVIFDFDGFSFSQIFQMSPSFLSMLFNWLQKSIPIPVGHVYIINNSFLFNILYSMAKPFLDAEYLEKLNILNSDYSKLVKDLGPNVLKKKFGGNAEDIPYGKLLYRLAEENFKILKNMTHYGYNTV